MITGHLRRRAQGSLPSPVIGYGYDAVGNLVTVTDALGRVTQYRYDALNRRTDTIDAAGARSTTQYDADGNVEQNKSTWKSVSSGRGL